MNSKEAKKIRQLQRREAVEIRADIDKRTTALIKLPPRFFPARLWFWLQGFFLNI
jgi:hypothetical protein